MPCAVRSRRSGRAVGCSGPFDVLRSASSLDVIIALAGAMMTGGVLDLIFWVFDPFGWKNEGQALRDADASQR